MSSLSKLDQALIEAKTAEQTEVLIKAGANVNVKDNAGWTALMNANTPKQTEVLIKAGANVNAKNNIGLTALMNANTPEQKKLIENAIEESKKPKSQGYSLPSEVIHKVFVPKGSKYEVVFI